MSPAILGARPHMRAQRVQIDHHRQIGRGDARDKGSRSVEGATAKERRRRRDGGRTGKGRLPWLRVSTTPAALTLLLPDAAQFRIAFSS